MGSILVLFTFVIGVFCLIAIWRIVMDLPKIVIHLKEVRILLIDLKERNTK